MRNSLAFLACACLVAACNSSSSDQSAPWIADAETDDVDGNLVIAIDAEGSPL